MNGPVEVEVTATGTLKDGSGNPYMPFTVRYRFYVGKNWWWRRVILRNAGNPSGGAFTIAVKGYAALEARQVFAASGTNIGYAGGTASIQSHALSSSDTLITQQLYSEYLLDTDWNADLGTNTPATIILRNLCSSGPDTYCYPNDTRTGEGYSIKYNASTLESGARAVSIPGWCADIAASGAGMMVGVEWGSGGWPFDCQINGAGATMALGLRPSQPINAYWMEWPGYLIKDSFGVDYGSGATSTLASNDFFKQNYPLVARVTDFNYYNTTGILPWTLPTAAAEDTYYNAVSAAASPSLPSPVCCILDQQPALNINWHAWGQPGGGNQSEVNEASLIQFWQRGFTGRYTNAQAHYLFYAAKAYPHADGFTWRGQASTAWDFRGFPGMSPGYYNTFGSSTPYSPANGVNGLIDWIDVEVGEHSWIGGAKTWYLSTGDPDVLAMITGGMEDRYLNTSSQMNNGDLWNMRSLGIQMKNLARLQDFCVSQGDSTCATTAYTVAETSLNILFRPQMQSGTGGYVNQLGQDPNRGEQYGCCSGVNWDNPPASSGPGGPGTARPAGAFQSSILIEGNHEYLQSRGSGWAGYKALLNQTYGLARWWSDEMRAPTTSWNPTVSGGGIYYYEGIDFCNKVSAPCVGGTQTLYNPETDFETQWFPGFFLNRYAHDTSLNSFYPYLLQGLAAASGINATEMAAYAMDAMVYQFLNPPANTLHAIPFVKTGLGSGNYSFSVTTIAPTAAIWVFCNASKVINTGSGVSPNPLFNLSYAPLTGVFGLPPSTNQAFWSSTDVSNNFSQTSSGTQVHTIACGADGLADGNFAALAADPGGTPPPPSGAGSPSYSGGSRFSGGVQR